MLKRRIKFRGHTIEEWKWQSKTFYVPDFNGNFEGTFKQVCSYIRRCHYFDRCLESVYPGIKKRLNFIDN